MRVGPKVTIHLLVWSPCKTEILNISKTTFDEEAICLERNRWHGSIAFDLLFLTPLLFPKTEVGKVDLLCRALLLVFRRVVDGQHR